VRTKAKEAEYPSISDCFLSLFGNSSALKERSLSAKLGVAPNFMNTIEV
jgi:hypothetical protein